MAIAAGTRFNQYELVSPIGAGGMGEVYLAEDTKLSRKVALKLLPAACTQDDARVRRFVQEAKAASALNHPNILTIHEIGEAAGAHFIATEFIDGATLRQRLSAERLPLNAALDISIQTASALTAAHEAGIVHRDIKPENVMLRRDGIIKVLDFGLAKLTEQRPAAVNSEAPTIAKVNTDPGTVMGTASYMSPEQARGQEVDARSDIFSLGVVLYEMVAGHAPFDGVNALDVIGAILNREPTPLKVQSPDTPAELQRIVTKALRKDREQRYQHVKDLLIDLKDLKQELEFEAKLKGVEAQRGGEPVVTAVSQPDKDLTNEVTVRTTSSAEYLISEIKRHKTGVVALLTVLLLALAGGGLGLYWLLTQPKPRAAGPAMRMIPFTTYPGSQGHPAFSPDGNQIAFSWAGEKGDNVDIYVKLVDGGSPLRLTTHPGQDYDPVWAPDGRSIAFFRDSPEGRGYYRVSALGGAERLLAEVKDTSYGITWSPDGKALIACEPGEAAAIYSITLETGERRKLITTPQGRLDAFPSVSPAGKSLAFFRMKTTATAFGDLYVVPLSGGEPKQITFDNLFINGLAWSADGSEIIFSSARGGGNPGNLWQVPVAGGAPEPVTLGADAIFPAVARQGSRLAFVQSVNETNIYRMSVPKQSGPPARFIASTLNENSAQYSPDGKRIVFSSTRSGSSEIWVCDSEGLNAAQLTSFGKSSTTGSPRWSPDGRKIVFDARIEEQADIYAISADGGAPRRLTTEPSEDIVPNWSRDGRWLYFCSGRSGSLQIWKMPAEGGQATQLTKQGGFECIESPDGHTLYYSKGRRVAGIWKVPVEGGEETPMVETDKAGFWRNWALSDQGIYFANSDQREEPVIEFFSFATSKVMKLATLDRPMNGNGIGLSPDGHWLLITLIDLEKDNIMLVENFR